MKKVVSLALALALAVVFAFSSFAAPSTGGKTSTGNAVDANGNPVDIVVQEIPAQYSSVVEHLKSTIKSYLGTDNVDLVFIEAHIEGDASKVAFPIRISFNVPQAAGNNVVGVLHYSTSAGAWEKVSYQQSGATVTATFNSLSPVAFAIEKSATSGASASGTSASGTTSPKTSDSNVEFFALSIAAVAVLGMAISFKKRAHAE